MHTSTSTFVLRTAQFRADRPRVFKHTVPVTNPTCNRMGVGCSAHQYVVQFPPAPNFTDLQCHKGDDLSGYQHFLPQLSPRWNGTTLEANRHASSATLERDVRRYTDASAPHPAARAGDGTIRRTDGVPKLQRKGSEPRPRAERVEIER